MHRFREAPAEHARQEDRDADDEPDVASREQGHASGRQPIDARRVRENPLERGLLLRLPDRRRQGREHKRKNKRDACRHRRERAAKAEDVDSSSPPRKKPGALERVLRAGQDRDPLEEPRFVALSGTSTLTALLALIFVRSFAMPDSAWHPMTYATDSRRLQSRFSSASSTERDDLEREARGRA